jgi:hypothetical protein
LDPARTGNTFTRRHDRHVAIATTQRTKHGI